MALQITITKPTQVILTNAYAKIVGYGMDLASGGIRTSVAFYASQNASSSGVQADYQKDYLLPNPVPLSLITPLADANGNVDVVAVMYTALKASEADFAGAVNV